MIVVHLWTHNLIRMLCKKLTRKLTRFDVGLVRTHTDTRGHTRAHAGPHGLVAGTAGRAGYTACVLPGFRVPGSLGAGGRLQRRISRPTLGARARRNLKIAPICVPREPERSWVSQICGSLID